MANATGRPLKYRDLIEGLEDDCCYSPASIINHAIQQGTFNPIDADQARKERIKIRHTLARFAKNHQFPAEGDGNVALPGQALSRGWAGDRWKQALPPRRERRASRGVHDVQTR